MYAVKKTEREMAWERGYTLRLFGLTTFLEILFLGTKYIVHPL